MKITEQNKKFHSGKQLHFQTLFPKLKLKLNLSHNSINVRCNFKLPKCACFESVLKTLDRQNSLNF